MTGERPPYPGLRAFEREEAHLFFGRDEETDTLVERLTANRFLGVLGASGSGKSSLVRTGLIEALEGGFGPAGSAWRIAALTPGGDPIGALAEALAMPAARLRRGPLSIVEWCEEGHLAPGCSLLLLVDQFEELFNYPDGGGDAHAFAALLVESARSPRRPVYVVLTMRSDYFGACGAFPALAEALSGSLFLTPRMLREACREAIEGPAAVTGVEIDPALLARLLNDMELLAPFSAGQQAEETLAGRQADQLPLMQYALNRLWRRAAAGEREGGPIRLTLDGYEAIGGLAGALGEHGDEVLAELNVPEAQVERVFQALVRGPSVSLAVRDPHRIGEVAAIADLDEAAVARVVDRFAGEDCRFLRARRPLGPGTFVDISHESLIRQWGKLSTWLKRGAEAGEQWRRLHLDAVEWDERGRGAEALLAGRQLSDRRAWWDAQRPTPAWVVRETPGVGDKAGAAAAIALVGDYFERSEGERLAEEEAERRTVRLLGKQRRERRLMAGGAAAALVLAAGTSAWWSEREQKNKQSQLVYEQDAQLLNAAKQAAASARERNDAVRIARAERAAADFQMRSAVENSKLAAASLDAQRMAERAEAEAVAARRSADEQASAARQAYASLLGNIERLARTVGGSGDSVVQAARPSADPPDGRAASVGERRARLELLAAEALVDRPGPAIAEGRVDPEVRDRLDKARLGSGDRDVRARAMLVEGRAQEQAGLFPDALDRYRRAFDGEGGRATPIAFAAATAAIDLRRRFDQEAPDIEAEVERRARWCETAVPDVPPDADAFVPAQACLVAAARRRLDGRRQDEAARLARTVDGIGWDAMATSGMGDGGDADAPETDLARLRVRIGARWLLAELDGVATDVEETLLRQARLHAVANPASESAAALYAGTLAANEAVELPALRGPLRDPQASTGFLLDAIDLLRRSSGEPDGPGDPGGLSSFSFVIRMEDHEDAIERQNLLLAAVARLRSRIDAGGRVPGRNRLAGWAEEAKKLRKTWIDGAAAQLSGYANASGLLDDLAASDRPDRVHLTDDDRERLATVAKPLERFCAAGPGVCARDRTAAQEPDAGRRLRALLDAASRLITNRGGRRVAAVGGDPSFDGVDLVALWRAPPGEAGSRAMRGRTDIERTVAGPVGGERATGEGGGKPLQLFFLSEANARAFDEAPGRFLPALDGLAADWLLVGERKAGDPRRSCVVGGRTVFFDTAAARQARCPDGRSDGRPAAAFLSDLERRRAAVAAGAAPTTPAGPVSPSAVASVDTLGRKTHFRLKPGAAVVVPGRGGRALLSTTAGNLRITHGDGAETALILTGGRFLAPPGLVAPGQALPYQGTVTALTWRRPADPAAGPEPADAP